MGGQITDTQTGLRGIPNPLIFKYLTIYGERFEYETTMLIETLRMRVPITEIPIQTVYINNNQETHFRPIQDSIAIYRLIFSSFFRYTLSSVSSFLIDYLLFCLFTAFFSQWELGGRIWISTILSRGISSFYNYNINRHAVFQKTGHSSRTLIRYYALCVLQLCCSSLFTLSVCRLTNIHEVIVKPLIDGILFLFSFQIQRIWVFGGKQ